MVFCPLLQTKWITDENSLLQVGLYLEHESLLWHPQCQATVEENLRAYDHHTLQYDIASWFFFILPSLRRTGGNQSDCGPDFQSGSHKNDKKMMKKKLLDLLANVKSKLKTLAGAAIQKP